MSEKLVKYATELHDEIISASPLVAARRGYLNALLIKDIMSNRIQVADLKVVESNLRSFGHKFGDGELADDLVSLAARMPSLQHDKDADPALVRSINGS